MDVTDPKFLLAKRLSDAVRHIRGTWSIMREIDDGEWILREPMQPAKTIEDAFTDHAPIFYQCFLNAMAIDVSAGICRLTDPAYMMNKTKEQLSLERIVVEITLHDPLKRNRLIALRKSIEDRAKPMRANRNTYLAHADLPTSLDPLFRSQLSRDDVQTIMDQLEEFVSLLSEHFGYYLPLEVNPIKEQGVALRALLAAGCAAIYTTKE